MSYPVGFTADYEEPRNRLTAFFRLILVIPAAIWVWLYAIVATVVVVIAWFVLLFSGRYPRSMFNLVAGYVRIQSLVIAYASLVCDPYLPFSGESPGYPVQVTFTGPLPQYSRLKVLFRILLAIPIIILRYGMNLLLEVGAVAAWCVILVLGRLPRGLFDLMVLANSYIARSDAYLLLLTETYPPFQDDATRSAGVQPGI